MRGHQLNFDTTVKGLKGLEASFNRSRNAHEAYACLCGLIKFLEKEAELIEQLLTRYEPSLLLPPVDQD